MHDAQRITGVLSPVVTPFKARLSPDPERFVRHCRWLLSQDVDAFGRSGFDVFAGSETFLLRNMQNGGAGCISATANVHPGPIARLYDTWQNADADAQQARLDEIRGVFQKFPMIPALKAAIAHYGNDAPWATVRPPLVALTSAQAKALVTELDPKTFAMPGLRG